MIQIYDSYMIWMIQMHVTLLNNNIWFEKYQCMSPLFQNKLHALVHTDYSIWFLYSILALIYSILNIFNYTELKLLKFMLLKFILKPIKIDSIRLYFDI